MLVSQRGPFTECFAIVGNCLKLLLASAVHAQITTGTSEFSESLKSITSFMSQVTKSNGQARNTA